MATNQYANKLEYYGVVKLDLTNDTVATNTLVSGVTAHNAAGEPITGTLSFVTYYIGTTNPASSLGSDGDIYLKVVS